MKTCTNGLPCPTALHCSMGCFFNEAETPHYRAMNAPLHSGNGGNTVSDGQALPKPVYIGDDLIEPVTSWFAVGALVSVLSLFAVLLVMAYQAGAAA